MSGCGSGCGLWLGLRSWCSIRLSDILESYGLEQIAVEVSGRTPSGRQLGQVLTRAKQAGARAVYVQPQFNRRAAQAVADELRCELRVLDPLPVDYIAGLEELATALLKP